VSRYVYDELHAQRLFDQRRHAVDDDPATCLQRGHGEHGIPLCPQGYHLRCNGHDHTHRDTK
jgi:hypothetical protein